MCLKRKAERVGAENRLGSGQVTREREEERARKRQKREEKKEKENAGVSTPSRASGGRPVLAVKANGGLDSGMTFSKFRIQPQQCPNKKTYLSPLNPSSTNVFHISGLDCDRMHEFFEEATEMGKLPDLVEDLDDDTDSDDGDSETDSEASDTEELDEYSQFLKHMDEADAAAARVRDLLENVLPHPPACGWPSPNPALPSVPSPSTTQSSPTPIHSKFAAPGVKDAREALADLRVLLNPPRQNGQGYVDPKINPFIRKRMEGMRTTLALFTDDRSLTRSAWAASSLHAAISSGHGRHCARRLRTLCRQFIADRTILPINPYGNWNQSMLVDEDLSMEIKLYLMELGNDISAQKLMERINSEDVRKRHEIDKTITERTARRYINSMGYRWGKPKKGQYADGHERDDVVVYRTNVFLPQWNRLCERMDRWSRDNILECGPRVPGREVVVWFHDETIFYAHDRRKTMWVHKDAPAKPYRKGEGASLMIADFVSAKFGWLKSPDGTRSARRVMKPGAAKDGYFTNEDICAQADEAMDILAEFYPEYEHVLVYDNATTHLKRAEDAISARKMPKFTPKLGSNWGVEVNQRDPLTGKPTYDTNRKLIKIKVRMGDAKFADGSPQPLYFPEGHELAGQFKGMAVILQERGLGDFSKVRAECPKFKCVPGAQNCCCRRVLYEQPDFVNVPSLLGERCKARGVQVLFLPKFHCELNFIEQCWGYAKRIYRLNPESSREDVLEKNALEALEQVPLITMRRFANRSARFMDAYTRGLNGRQAAWAARKYRGHRVLPESIMDELEKQQIN